MIWFDWNWIDLIWLDWFDLNWNELKWIELNWIELNWLGSIWKTSGRHLRDIWASREHPGDTQEAPRRHQGGTQEAPRRQPGVTQGHPGHPEVSKRSWEQKGQHLYAKMQENKKNNHVTTLFWRSGSPSTAPGDKIYPIPSEAVREDHQGLSIKTARTPTDEICLGN